MKKIGVLTSGGDSPGMNAAIRAIVRNGIYHNLTVVGIRRGFQGLIEKDFVAMNVSSVADIIQRGGTMLRTARSKAFMDSDNQKIAYKNLVSEHIDGLIVIGGDGSFRGAEVLARQGMNIFCIPATIDNDIAETDYTIGFDTALNTVLSAINNIRDTATSHEKNFLVEVMGRNSGSLALSAGLAGGAESILIPEIPYDLENVVTKIKSGQARGKLHSIIVMAEGVGSAFDIAKDLIDLSGFDISISVLGYVQRGGTPTATDRINASRMGAYGIEQLLMGESNKMAAIKGGEVFSVDISKIVSKPKGIKYSDYDLANVLSI